ncbi:MAG: hypothetical protein LBI40_00435 [Treponema sp.]|jgi:hypothetical protein|nr:hypothetical protein [Treponema sp.]
MVQFSRQRLRVLAAYVAVAVMGMFSLYAVDPIRAVVFELKTISDVVFDVSSAYITQQHSADEEAAITKTSRASLSPFRMCSYRVILPLGSPSDTVSISFQKSFPTGVQMPQPHFNNAIPLKLRN